ncbi:MAG: pseudouridine synthase [Ignavibacteriaceae bacterium]
MHHNKLRYFIINKPYGVLSQFSDKQGRKTLKDFFRLAGDVYPVGRLDMNSEGLLLLTNDKSLTDFLLNPANKHEREYLVQVEGEPGNYDLELFQEGLLIKGIKTLGAKAIKINTPDIWERIPPIRERKNIPVSWLKVILIEGRNRQIRKMTAKIGFPTLRLIRTRIKNILLDDLLPGKTRELSITEIEKLKTN